MKIYATLRTLGLISVVIFGLFFCVCRRTICVCELYVFTLCKRRSLLTLLHTHKRCGFCLRKARVPDTNSIIFIVFYVCVEKKKKSKWKLQASAGGWTEYRVPLFVWNKKFVASYIFTKYDWESTLKKKVACFTCGIEVETALHLSDQSFWSSKRQWQKCICTFVLFEFLSCTFRSVVQVLAWVSSRSRYRTAERVLYQWRK